MAYFEQKLLTLSLRLSPGQGLSPSPGQGPGPGQDAVDDGPY
jgi:hypothetical protein